MTCCMDDSLYYFHPKINALFFRFCQVLFYSIMNCVNERPNPGWKWSFKSRFSAGQIPDWFRPSRCWQTQTPVHWVVQQSSWQWRAEGRAKCAHWDFSVSASRQKNRPCLVLIPTRRRSARPRPPVSEESCGPGGSGLVSLRCRGWAPLELLHLPNIERGGSSCMLDQLNFNEKQEAATSRDNHSVCSS